MTTARELNRYVYHKNPAMPSNAYQNYRKNLKDVRELIKSHDILNHDGKGKRGLGHITRSGVVMLCAAWEVYSEEVILECVDCFISCADDPSGLPLPVRKNISRKVKDADHDLKPLELAGDGWEDVYRNYAKQETDNLHTPKNSKLNHRFRQYLGIEDISECWSVDADEIDHFVSVRGEIAHNGSGAQYVQINNLKKYLSLIRRTTAETDNYLGDYVKEQYPSYRRPWNRLDLNELDT